MALTERTAAEMAENYTSAWNSGRPELVASFFAPDGRIEINRGEPSIGTEAIARMAAGFFSEVPDLSLTCDKFRLADSHAVFAWTFTGRHSETGNPLRVSGWEEWDLDADGTILASRGWFDAADYARQVEGA